MDFKFDITDLVINSFPQIDEAKKEKDLITAKKIDRLRSRVYIILAITNIISLVFISLNALNIVSDTLFIVFGIIFTISICLVITSSKIFDTIEDKISYTFSVDQYEYIDCIKQFWKNISDVLKEETTLISFIREKDGNKLKVSYLKKDGQLYSKKFRLSKRHILFKDVPSFAIDFDLSEDPFISNCTNFIIPQKYYKNFVEQLN